MCTGFMNKSIKKFPGAFEAVSVENMYPALITFGQGRAKVSEMT